MSPSLLVAGLLDPLVLYLGHLKQCYHQQNPQKCENVALKTPKGSLCVAGELKPAARNVPWWEVGSIPLPYLSLVLTAGLVIK